MDLTNAASILVWMKNVVVAIDPPRARLRRPTPHECARGLPNCFWVRDIVRSNGRRDKEFFSQHGVKFRSLKKAAQSFSTLFDFTTDL